MLPVSLDCPLLIALMVFSNVIYLVYPMLSISLDCPVLIASMVFCNVYLSCVPYVTSFPGLSFVDCPYGIL